MSETRDPPALDPRYAAALAKQKAEREAAKQKTPRRRPILRIVGGTDYDEKTQEQRNVNDEL